MTTAFDTRFRALADRLVSKFGTDITLISVVNTYDPESNSVTSSAETQLTVKCSPPVTPSEDEIDDNHVLSGDKVVVVAATDVASLEPLTAESLHATLSGERYSVVSVRPWQSGDLMAAYELRLRR